MKFVKELPSKIFRKKSCLQIEDYVKKVFCFSFSPLSKYYAPSITEYNNKCIVYLTFYPQIQWYHNGRQLKPSNRYEMKYTREGYCSLRVRNAFPDDAGYYTGLLLQRFTKFY